MMQATGQTCAEFVEMLLTLQTLAKFVEILQTLSKHRAKWQSVRTYYLKYANIVCTLYKP